MMMDAVREVMFDNAYLDTATNHVSRCNSHAVVMQGNRVMINGMILKSSDGSTDNLVLTLEGSYDGQVWLTTNLGTLSIAASASPNNSSSSVPIDDVEYTFLRLRAEVTKVESPTPRVFFNADIVMSHQ